MTYSSEAETDVNQLSADVQALKRDLAALAGHGGSAAAGAASAAAGAAGDAANAVGAHAQRLYDNVASHSSRQAEALAEQVEEHPLTALLIAFGVGFVFARILPR